jgi:hypothetical protein
MTQYTVKYDLTEKEEAALRELLPNYRQYISAGGRRPFENYTLEDVFQSLMYIGSRHTIWRQIKEEQFRQNLIDIDQLIDDKYLTIAERNAHTDEGSEDTWKKEQ